MARLIDADALKKKLSEMEDEYRAKLCENCIEDPFSDGILSALFSVFQVIANQPTAYDVEKVVKELEEEKQRLRNLKNDCIALCDSEVIAIEEKSYNYAIGVVRKGGVE